jgi:hypothetical protein
LKCLPLIACGYKKRLGTRIGQGKFLKTLKFFKNIC